jgi:hypothetical protein
MAIFDKVVDFLTGGIGEKIVEATTKYFPPRLSDAEKSQIEQAIRQAAREHEIQLLSLAQKEQEDFHSRLKDLEGTASDLTGAGWMGRVIIFLRGAQRPLWGYFVLIMDVMVFSGHWKIASIQQQATTALDVSLDLQSAFWVINILVLGFLFGERAVRNVMPMVQKRMGGGDAAQPEIESAKG